MCGQKNFTKILLPTFQGCMSMPKVSKGHPKFVTPESAPAVEQPAPLKSESVSAKGQSSLVTPETVSASVNQHL